jgi:Tfp pilus assembly protein PilF
MHGKTLIIGLLLCTLTFALYWQVRSYEFIALDDPAYVIENKHVQKGFNIKSIIWAFTSFHAGYWIPLTWLSLMLDFELYGLNPGGFHFTNLLLHLANTLLLLLVLKRMTGAVWKSAIVAALFSLHPLHVESVAWITERKDVLSTLFWLLSILAYLRYLETRKIGSYLLTCSAFALGLMAKPMLVTLPFLLLLLDYWPLHRFQAEQRHGSDPQAESEAAPTRGKWFIPRLLLEKLPLFVLATAASLVTFYSQQSWDWAAVKTMYQFPLTSRFANALVSYVSYIGKMFWPANLAVLYPHPGSSIPPWQIVGAVLVLTCISIAVIRGAHRYPYLVVGWFWYLGTLVPVIGLVQAGDQAMADRFTYVPLIGLCIMVVWGVPDLVAKRRSLNRILPVTAVLLLSVLAVCSWFQLKHWRNSITLFEHTLKVTNDNYLIHNNLGSVLYKQGKTDKALRHYLKSLEIQPNSAEVHYNIGQILSLQGRLEEAIPHYVAALRVKPDFPEVLNNLAWTFATHRNVNLRNSHKAVELAEQACALTDYMNPNFLDTLAAAYARANRFPEAVQAAQKAVRIALGSGHPDLAREIENRLELYRVAEPYDEG